MAIDMSKNIFIELKMEYKFMTKVEKKIADLLLEDPRKFTTYSIAELSNVADVSQGSINNFSKKFSSGGYSALKLKIAGCIPHYEEKPFTVVETSNTVMDVLEMKIKESMIAFHNTLEINDETSLKSAVDKILKARKIEIYGVYYSGIVARDLCYRLIQLGIPASFVGDMLMCSVSASMLTKENLVIAISASGRTKEIVDAVKIAKENDVPVICMTSHKASPLGSMADDVLMTASSGISISEKSAETRMAQLFLADALCAYLQSVIDSTGDKRYYKVNKILSSHIIDN